MGSKMENGGREDVASYDRKRKIANKILLQGGDVQLMTGTYSRLLLFPDSRG